MQYEGKELNLLGDVAVLATLCNGQDGEHLEHWKMIWDQKTQAVVAATELQLPTACKNFQLQFNYNEMDIVSFITPSFKQFTYPSQSALIVQKKTAISHLPVTLTFKITDWDEKKARVSLAGISILLKTKSD